MGNGVPGIVRVLLLGGQGALLAGLIAFAAWRITWSRSQPLEPVADESEQPEAPAPSRRAVRPRQLPVVVAPPCTPRPGHACWRGQVRLSEEVRKVWADGREQERRAKELEREQRQERVRALREEGAQHDDSEDEVGEVVHDPAAEEQPEPPLPPLGPWTAHAAVFAYPRQVPTGAGGAASEASREAVEAALQDDGSFELQVPPGVYDVELRTHDDRLVAFVDGLTARVGAAEAGLDLVPLPTVAIAGRVVDGDGIGAEGTVSVESMVREEGQVASTDDGRFRFDGLRRGTYQVTATVEGATRKETIEVHAPITGVELRVRWLPEGLVLVAPQADGSCPRGALELRRTGGRPGRRLHFEKCQAPTGFVSPGIPYRVKGNLAGRSYDTEVVFADAPAPPICLDPRCGSDAAARIRVVDLAGVIVDRPTVLEMGDGADTVSTAWLGTHFRNGLRSGMSVNLRATLGDSDDGTEVTGTTTAWLAPGINQILIRLPQTVAALPELPPP